MPYSLTIFKYQNKILIKVNLGCMNSSFRHLNEGLASLLFTEKLPSSTKEVWLFTYADGIALTNGNHNHW